jgi:hypothetical protein
MPDEKQLGLLSQIESSGKTKSLLHHKDKITDMLKNRLNVDLRVIHIQFFAYILSIRACHVAKEHARSDFASEDLLITCDDGTGPRIVSGYQVDFRHAPSGTVILKAWERDR